ncbi:MAG: hypothetical protein A3F54_01735 [Candidatus Kerfeldbacteria bacterium RIFCSPHIGHO2_12_FULL_48_17]|uniref:Uncharacterized protein n=1 Tax=Candidatus Kerfeldbacteria bacterium RIFCSPHIGHO2_12_FULL_48_17 TaxID=1798542 RepID=A0A1G2B3A9_9BACT|nr:MAG: hypothetical protein A3F54_01735 [Candidatus Kerfeldbacteria bacterium RIFCSPHIGHO2_12_FULL_48_17]
MEKEKVYILGGVGVLILGGVLFFAGKLYVMQRNGQEIQAYMQENVAPAPVPEGYLVTEMQASLPAEATTKNIANTANLIVRGKVTTIGEAYSDQLGFVYHNVIIQPEKFYKNTTQVQQNADITVKVFGGTKDKEIFRALDAPRFAQNEQVFVFLGKGEKDYYVTYEIFGKLTIKDNKVEGINQEQGRVSEKLSDYEKKVVEIIGQK